MLKFTPLLLIASIASFGQTQRPSKMTLVPKCPAGVEMPMSGIDAHDTTPADACLFHQSANSGKMCIGVGDPPKIYLIETKHDFCITQNDIDKMEAGCSYALGKWDGKTHYCHRPQLESK